MALDDALRRHSAPVTQPCVIGALVAQLDDNDRQALLAAMADDTVETIAIVRALADEGYTVARTTLVRHRKAECSCVRVSA